MFPLFRMEEKLLHSDKVLYLGREVVADRLILASLQSFSSVFPDLTIRLAQPHPPPLKFE